MKAKNGISLIVLVITIVVIIILAAAVILSLGQNNPINNSRVAALTQTRDNLQSAVSLYLAQQFAKFSGVYDAGQILTGAEGTNLTPVIGTEQSSSNSGYYLVDVAAAKSQLEIELPSQTTEKWYVSPSNGKAVVKFVGSTPSYLKENGELLESVSAFVTE